MKKLVIFLGIFFVWMASPSFSQQTVVVKTYRACLKPGISKSALDINLNFKKALLPAFTYQQAYPGAKNPELLNYYYLYIWDSTYHPSDSSAFRDVFSSLSEIPVSSPLAECAHPVQVNDSLLAVNDWHLQSVNAYCAWEITTGDPSIIVGVVDYNTEGMNLHEDLTDGLNGKFVEITHGLRPNGDDHGILVSGTVAAVPNNGKGLAGIGYNTLLRLLGLYRYKYIPVTDEYRWFEITGTKAEGIWYSYQMGDKIINLSWPNTELIPAAVEEITQQSLLVLAAGNKDTNKYHYDIANIPGVILVSSTEPGGIYHSNHARHDRIDICAPGVRVPILQKKNGYSQDGGNGTSNAAPMVAGTAALMLSVNRNLTPALLEKIIKSTADPIANEYLYPGLIGAGKLNAYKAVKTAKYFSEKLDLYMQDTPEDAGQEPNFDSEFLYVSQDIWVRNLPDGMFNHMHQNPKYEPNRPAYVYVRVRNKSAEPSSGTEELHLHWSKAGPYWDWPGPWIGDMQIGSAPLGNLINIQNIPIIEPGGERILRFEWFPPSPAIYESITTEPWHFCLMTRVESGVDSIHEHTSLGDYIRNNNNVAMKNVTVIDNTINPGKVGGTIGFLNGFSIQKKFRLHFKIPVTEMEHPITNEAEVSLRLSEGLYRAWEIMGHEGRGIKDIGKSEVLITEPDAYLEFELHPEEFHTVYAGFNFLTQEITEKPTFECFLELECQIEGEKYETLGGEQYVINKWERDLFKANAGNDKLVSKNESIQLQARSISETATYNWYDINDSLLYTGKDFTTATGQTQKYKLEVIAEKDGYKDYDEVTVKVKEFEIKRLSPNPARTDLTVEYDVQNAASAYLYVFNANGILVRTILLNPQSDSITINVSNYQQGSYSIALVCNGQITDSKTFVVN